MVAAGRPTLLYQAPDCLSRRAHVSSQRHWERRCDSYCDSSFACSRLVVVWRVSLLDDGGDHIRGDSGRLSSIHSFTQPMVASSALSLEVKPFMPSSYTVIPKHPLRD